MPDFTQVQRQRLAARNRAMPDGGFPIRNVSDLKNAIKAYGRAKNKPAVKKWIKKRARQLGREDLLPENWRTSEVVTHTTNRNGGVMWTYNYYDPDVIMHHGIKGMKWGVRRYQNEDGTLTAAGKKRAAKSLTKEYRKSRKTDPRTDFLKLNRANSAARDYYRTQRTRSFLTYRKSESKMNRKISGLSKDQIENGRYRVARARNIAAKSIAGLAAAGVGVATLGMVPAAALLTVPITAVGMNYLNGGHYYQGQSATYGSRKAAQKVDADERNKKREIKSSKKKGN